MSAPSVEPKDEGPGKDAGSILKQRRLLRGQSLETVHQHTRIPKKFLQALEDSAFDVFPAPVYLRGFLKNYCDFLDIEFEPLWAQVTPKPAQASEGQAPQAATERAAPPSSESPAPRCGAQPPDEAPRRTGAPERAEAGSRSLFPLNESAIFPTLLFAALVILGALLWTLKGKPRQHGPGRLPASGQAEQPAPPQASTAPVVAPSPAPAVAQTGATAQPPRETAAPQSPEAALPRGNARSPAPARPEVGTLRITALEGTWMRLEIDGRLVFEGHLPSGTTQDFKGRKEFRLRAAEPRALSMELDGVPSELLKYPAAPDGTRAIKR